MLGSAILGVTCASSTWTSFYHHILAYSPLSTFPLSLHQWVNQGLMTLFFVSLAFEIRYDMRPDGPLGHWQKAALPLVGAFGGMAVPACIAILCAFSLPHSPGLKGWAIPTATDAAFTVPVLALIPGLPASLRSFLMALAIFDDLGAIIILALFYGQSPHILWLLGALLPTLGLVVLGKKHLTSFGLTLPLTAVLWVCLFKAGVEPTLAGVVFGLCTPPQRGHTINHRLVLPVGLAVLPLFAFMNSGINLRLISPSFLVSAPLLGAALGLWVGKPLGISGAVWLAQRYARLPSIPFLHGRSRIGIGMVCGIGFTMSLLITSLAYPDSTSLMQGRCGVLLGSLLSAGIGWAILRSTFKPASRTNSEYRK